MNISGWTSGKSIEKQIIVTTSISVLFAVLVLGIALMINSAYTTSSIVNSKGEAMANFLERVGRIYLADYNVPQLEIFVMEAIKDTKLEFVVYYDKNNSPLTGSSVEPDDLSGIHIHEREITIGGSQLLGVLRLGYSANEVSEIVWETIFLIIFCCLAAIAVVVPINYRMIGRITKPIKVLSADAERLRLGDLDIDSKETEDVDEVSSLQNAFVAMADSFKDIMGRLMESANRLTGNISQITATAKEAAATAAEQASTVAEVSATIEEINQTGKAASESAKEVVNVSEEAVGKGMEGADAVFRAVESIESLAATVDKLSATIIELNQRGEKIGEIAGVVTQLADQSNILAINAGIEAAKAGEHGRGFAFVATEVRNLAEQSKDAAGQISNIVKDVVSVTDKAVVIAVESVQGAADGREAIDAVSTFMSDIAMVLTESVDQATRIAGATRQQSQGIAQIAQAMGAVEKSGQDTASGAKNLEDAALDLSALADEIKGILKRFGGDKSSENDES